MVSGWRVVLCRAAERRQEPAPECLGRLRACDRQPHSRHNTRHRHRADRPRRLARRAGRYGGPACLGRPDRSLRESPWPGARQGEADLILLVLDRSEPLTESDRQLVATTEQALIVANKCDRPSAWETTTLPHALAVSAERGDGIEALGSAIARRLVPHLLLLGPACRSVPHMFANSAWSSRHSRPRTPSAGSPGPQRTRSPPRPDRSVSPRSTLKAHPAGRSGSRRDWPPREARGCHAPVERLHV